MAGFSSLFPDESLIAALGDDAVYLNHCSEPVSLKVVFEFDLQRTGGDGYTIESQTEVEFLQCAIPNKPARGDVIVFEDVPYEVDAITMIDDAYYRVVVKK